MSQFSIIEETSKTPLVEFDSNQGALKITGKIISENPIAFFDQMDGLISEYIKQNRSNVLTADIFLDYFNTVCSKYFLKFLQKIISSKDSADKVKIKWHFEKDDSEIKEAGEDYSAIINHPFELIEIKA